MLKLVHVRHVAGDFMEMFAQLRVLKIVVTIHAIPQTAHAAFAKLDITDIIVYLLALGTARTKLAVLIMAIATLVKTAFSETYV